MKRPTPITPKPGQESVWDYPRPAKLEDTNKRLKVVFNDIVLAQTTEGYRVLETSHPPVYYFPAKDVKLEYLKATERKTWCEWKGKCIYYHIILGDKKVDYGAWRYFEPVPQFEAIQDYYGFYASAMDACYVGEEKVEAQPGDYYGGWITSNIVGPFKGSPGTMGW